MSDPTAHGPTDPDAGSPPAFGAPGAAARPAGVPADPDIAPAPSPSTLADLRAELATAVVAEDLVLEVPLRPGWTVRYSCDVSKEEIKKWRKAAADKKAEGGVDELRMGELVVVNKAEAIAKNGQEVVGEDGVVLSFRHPETLTLYGVGKAVEAASEFYGSDGHVTAAARQVLEQAGWGDELATAGADGADPTPRS